MAAVRTEQPFLFVAQMPCHSKRSLGTHKRVAMGNMLVHARTPSARASLGLHWEGRLARAWRSERNRLINLLARSMPLGLPIAHQSGGETQGPEHKEQVCSWKTSFA